MKHESRYEGPSNDVGLNRYVADSKRRVMTGSVQKQQWYVARLIDPDSESVGKFAKDFLMQVREIKKLTDGTIKVYAQHVGMDDSVEVSEADAVPMTDGYFIENGHEAGYFLSIFANSPNSLGVLAAEATVEIHRRTLAFSGCRRTPFSNTT